MPSLIFWCKKINTFEILGYESPSPIQLNVDLQRTYPIYIDENLLATTLLADYCRTLNKRFVIISDDNVGDIVKTIIRNLKQAQVFIEYFSFPAGENHKTRETKQMLEDRLLDKQYGRDTCLIAVGGGVTCDLVGFLASTYCRGISCIYIPTTLLAMVDASIGGKTGVNTPQGKNLIGTFQQPHAVFMDISTLNTLPAVEWRNGMAEIIKHSLIADAQLFAKLNTSKNRYIDIIYQSCLIKKNIVEQDEKEQGLRQLLNYGHTIGHAIEKIENYQIAHGEAVAMGMLIEAQLSVQCGFLSQTDFTAIENILRKYQFPLKTNVFHHREAFYNALKMDKKAKANQPHFVLLDGIGKAHTHQERYAFDVDPALLNKALDWAIEKKG